MTTLTDRLDDLMVRLHQEGRDEDAGLILAAIEALTRPAGGTYDRAPETAG